MIGLKQKAVPYDLRYVWGLYQPLSVLTEVELRIEESCMRKQCLYEDIYSFPNETL